MGFFFDIKCFFGTFVSVLKHDGVVEGGTGTLNEQKKTDDAVNENTSEAPVEEATEEVNE